MTRPLCEACKRREATIRGEAMIRPSRRLTRVGLSVYLCDTCPKPKHRGGRRLRYRNLTWETIKP